MDVRMDNRTIKDIFKPIYRNAEIRSFWNTFFFGIYYTSRINPLPILFIFGLVGILIDLDHFIIKQTQMVRPLHLPIWIGIGIVCICYFTYINRRIHNNRMKV